MFERLCSAAETVFAIYGEQDFGALLLIAIAVVAIARHFCPADYRYQSARQIAAALSFPYLLYLYPRCSFDDFVLLLVALIRLYVFYLLLLGTCMLVVPSTMWISSKVRFRIRRIREWWREHQKHAQEKHEQRRQQRFAREHPPALPVPRSELLKQQMEDAHRDYEAEAKLIEESPALDDDERKVALMQSKQRLLERINRIIR